MRISGIVVSLALAVAVITLCSCEAQQNPSSGVSSSEPVYSTQPNLGEFLITEGQSFTVRCGFEGEAVLIQSSLLQKGLAFESNHEASGPHGAPYAPRLSLTSFRIPILAMS